MISSICKNKFSSSYSSRIRLLKPGGDHPYPCHPLSFQLSALTVSATSCLARHSTPVRRDLPDRPYRPPSRLILSFRLDDMIMKYNSSPNFSCLIAVMSIFHTSIIHLKTLILLIQTHQGRRGIKQFTGSPIYAQHCASGVSEGGNDLPSDCEILLENRP